MMRRMILMVSLMLAGAVGLMAQSAPQFTMTSQAVMARIGSKIEAGTIATGTMAVSTHFAVRSDNLLLPGPGVGLNTAGIQYSNVLGKSEFSYNINGGVGMVSSPAPMHFAANAGYTLLFSPKGEPKLSVTIVNVQFFHGGVTDGPTQTSNWFAIGTGLQLDLSKIF